MSLNVDLTSHPKGESLGTVLADPPWRFANRTGKAAPEHRRLLRYETLSLEEIAALPVADPVSDVAHCYLMERFARGVGNPCPLLLVGLPASREGNTDETQRIRTKEITTSGDRATAPHLPAHASRTA